MARTEKVPPKYMAEGRDKPLELWPEDTRLAHDTRPFPTIHEGTVHGSYTNSTPCGIRYTDEFTLFLGGSMATGRETLLRDYVTPEEFRTLLHWRDVSKVLRCLRRGVLSGRQPGGRDTAWEIPVRVVLTFMEVNAYLPAEIDEVHQRCLALTQAPARARAS